MRQGCNPAIERGQIVRRRRRTGEHQVQLRVGRGEMIKRLHKEELSLLRINPAHAQNHPRVRGNGMLRPERRAVPLGKTVAVDAVGQVENPVVPEAPPGVRGFAAPDADDGVDLLEDASRTEERTRKTAPFELARLGLDELGELRRRHVKDAAVEGDDIRPVAQSRRGSHDAAEALRGMGVKDSDARRAQQGAEQGPRQQVAAFLVHGLALLRIQAEKRVTVGEALDRHAVE